MTAFRILLVSVPLVILVYTAKVIDLHGMGFIGVFFGDIARIGWPGQFNLDFLCLLGLAGLWLAWRHRFSPAGLACGVAMIFGGAPFLSVYLLVASLRAGGRMAPLLLGESRSRGLAADT